MLISIRRHAENKQRTNSVPATRDPLPTGATCDFEASPLSDVATKAGGKRGNTMRKRSSFELTVQFRDRRPPKAARGTTGNPIGVTGARQKRDITVTEWDPSDFSIGSVSRKNKNFFSKGAFPMIFKWHAMRYPQLS